MSLNPSIRYRHGCGWTTEPYSTATHLIMSNKNVYSNFSGIKIDIKRFAIIMVDLFYGNMSGSFGPCL